MFSISSVSNKLLAKLRRKPYRDAYVSEHVRRGIAAQVRALRDQRSWNQGKLSSLLGKPQSVVSRLEDPGYGKVTVQTLLEIASVFDVALQIRFVSYGLFLQQTRNLTDSSMQVQSFQDDLAAKAASEIVVKLNNDAMKGGITVIDVLSGKPSMLTESTTRIRFAQATLRGVSGTMSGFSVQ